MNTTGTWTNAVPGNLEEQARLAARKALTLSIAIVSLATLLNIWLFIDSKKGLREENFNRGARSDLVARVDRSIISVGAVGIIAMFGSLASLIAASRTWQRHFVTSLDQIEAEHRTELATAVAQMTEARRVRDQSQITQAKLEERIKSLTASQQSLQEKLDKRDRAERALAAKRQELEISRNVLELHVQARTQELQNLQRRYEMILNSAGEGICGFDVEGRLTFANPAVNRITGWSPEELIGRTEEEIFWAEEGSQSEAQRAGSRHDNYGDGVFRRKDDKRFAVEFVRTPINEEGRVVGSVLVFKDITERKLVEDALSQKAAELARSNSELEQFAFVASHDLQEPLRKIQAFGDRLKIRCNGSLSDDARDYLERMQNASARMRTLINDLLAFSRVIRSAEPFVPVELGKVVREVLGDLELPIEKSHAKVDVGSLPQLEADPMQMRQLFQNLVSNALKFQPPGGVPAISISSRVFAVASGKSLCEIRVQDNGIGFDEKYVDRIFAVFQRLHGRGEYEGTGVGLAVCRRIVDRHSGTIVAHSRPGEGATFIITLPMTQAKSESMAA